MLFKIKQFIDDFRNLHKKRIEAEKWVDELRLIVESDKRFVVWNKTNWNIEYKEINVPFPLIILDGNNTFTNNMFKGK